MHTDRDFLATIDTRPGDRAFRLIYADWLEERNDPRGELIRVEEEMRQLPVYSDPFWALKPRRNELRSQADAGWLARMKYGTECEPVFRHGVPDGWRERWRLIREFTERWYRKPMPDVGGKGDEIRETKQRLGRELPPSVCEWAAYVCDVSSSEQSPGDLQNVCVLEKVPGRSALALVYRWDRILHWAVRYVDLNDPDPPVYGYCMDYEPGGEKRFTRLGQNPETDTTTEFVFGFLTPYLLTRWMSGLFSRSEMGTQVSNPSQLAYDLIASFPIRARFGRIEVFEADNLLVRLHHSGNHFYLQVELFKPLPRKTVPEFLCEYISNTMLIP